MRKTAITSPTPTTTTVRLAYFGTASYSYRSRYIINGTIRYEGSNKLGKSSQSRWLPTWNVSGAWNADAEEWFQNPVLATAKLRLSYSLTADGGPANVSNATAIYYPSRPWRQEDDSRELGIELYDLANSELTYEKKHELDIGVDLGFLNNRINLSFDWYKRDNFDLIGYVFTQGVGGINTKLANNANLASHGVEFTLTTHNIQGRDLSWTTDWTFSYAKNKITNLQSRSRVIDLIQGSGYAIEGYPVRAIFSIPFVGLSETGLPVSNSMRRAKRLRTISTCRTSRILASSSTKVRSTRPLPVVSATVSVGRTSISMCS